MAEIRSGVHVGTGLGLPRYRHFMQGIPLFLTYAVICLGAATAVGMMPAHQAIKPVATSSQWQIRAGGVDHIQSQLAALGERVRADFVLVEQRPPVPFQTPPRQVYIEPSAVAPAAASAADPAAIAILRPPKAVAQAIEADGYRGVRVLERGTDGKWRALALRGNVEVALSVDDSGTVLSR